MKINCPKCNQSQKYYKVHIFRCPNCKWLFRDKESPCIDYLDWWNYDEETSEITYDDPCVIPASKFDYNNLNDPKIAKIHKEREKYPFTEIEKLEINEIIKQEKIQEIYDEILEMFIRLQNYPYYLCDEDKITLKIWKKAIVNKKLPLTEQVKHYINTMLLSSCEPVLNEIQSKSNSW